MVKFNSLLDVKSYFMGFHGIKINFSIRESGVEKKLFFNEVLDLNKKSIYWIIFINSDVNHVYDKISRLYVLDSVKNILLSVIFGCFLVIFSEKNWI